MQDQENKKRMTVFYVIGAGHSGSTVLDILMARHSQVVGVGELQRFGNNEEKMAKMACACGKKAGFCSFWQSVAKSLPIFYGLAIHRNRFNFLLNSHNFVFKNKKQKGEQVAQKAYLALNEKLYQNIIKCSGKKVVFDSSKEADRAELLLQSQNLEIILVHLVRDGRGVVWSYKRKYNKLLSAISRWLFLNLKAEIIKKRHKQAKQIFVRYEDLVIQPEKELTRLLRAVGLVFEEQMLDFSNQQSQQSQQGPQHQIAGNRLRLQGISQLKEDLTWQQGLDSFDRLIFYLLAGWFNKVYGY